MNRLYGFAISLFLSFGAAAAPTVSLTAPSNGNLYLAPATFAVKANASSSGATITKVEFYANGTLIQTHTTNPYQFDWSGVAAGTYSINAIAYDSNGADHLGLEERHGRGHQHRAHGEPLQHSGQRSLPQPVRHQHLRHGVGA